MVNKRKYIFLIRQLKTSFVVDLTFASYTSKSLIHQSVFLTIESNNHINWNSIDSLNRNQYE